MNNIWNVGDRATVTSGSKCIVMAISESSAAIQYIETGNIDIVFLRELRPNFSPEDEKAIKKIFQIISEEQDYRDAAESLYLEGYRKQEECEPKDMTDPANWGTGDLIQCNVENEPYITFRSIYRIKDNSEGIVGVIDDEGDCEYYLPTKFKFFSRGDT